ncbi:hypothetical protein NQ318_020686 [Aromia moschata]|uniref:Uncharacterized protein n=1 Tax=Aromia moschata TaxID=1265417 RepID=A0AAV8XNV7_9CUCU|nr:hypothetical protein NQ318_020686 [Aromia moschata]
MCIYFIPLASDGQHIYLHAINARMLEHAYGSLEFGPKTITGKILEKEEQIEIRRKRRQRRAKEEKRREKRIEAEENRKMGKYPVPNLHLESNIQFPEFGTEVRSRTESEGTLPSERSLSPDLFASSSSMSVDSVYSGPSFATMLAMEKKQAPAWPDLKSSSSAEPPRQVDKRHRS